MPTRPRSIQGRSAARARIAAMWSSSAYSCGRPVLASRNARLRSGEPRPSTVSTTNPSSASAGADHWPGHALGPRAVDGERDPRARDVRARVDAVDHRIGLVGVEIGRDVQRAEIELPVRRAEDSGWWCGRGRQGAGPGLDAAASRVDRHRRRAIRELSLVGQAVAGPARCDRHVAHPLAHLHSHSAAARA